MRTTPRPGANFPRIHSLLISFVGAVRLFLLVLGLSASGETSEAEMVLMLKPISSVAFLSTEQNWPGNSWIGPEMSGKVAAGAIIILLLVLKVIEDLNSSLGAQNSVEGTLAATLCKWVPLYCHRCCSRACI